MEPLFCIRMVLDESVLREYAARNMQADRDGFKRMKFKLVGFLIALLLIGIVTRDPGRTLLTGGVAVAALAVLERKQRSQKGRREEFERQVNWMKQHLVPGELGSETVYCFLEQEMTWDNERSRGKLDYSLIQNVVETEQGFFVLWRRPGGSFSGKLLLHPAILRRFGNFWSKEVPALPGLESKGGAAAVAYAGTYGRGRTGAPDPMYLAPALGWAEYVVPALGWAEYVVPVPRWAV